MTDVTPLPDVTAPMTFAAFAVRIGKSRPYISSLVAKGVIRAPALTDQRLIIAPLAETQIAESATRPKTSAASESGAATSGTLNAERLRLVTEQADRQAMENAVRRGELITRSALSTSLPPLARRYAERIQQLVRDTITDDVERASLIDLIATDAETFIAEALTHGGAAPAPG